MHESSWERGIAAAGEAACRYMVNEIELATEHWVAVIGRIN